jgi:glycosyltransferase involved in cell wall biosynthesis
VTGPWLSVIMPTYNGGAMLAEALASVAREADQGVEVIAIDDGSTDVTLDVLASYADRLSLTVVRRRVENWVTNTNYGLELATGSWACILHQDDVWRHGRLRAVRQQLSATPGLSLLLHDCRFIDTVGRDLGPWTCPLAPRRALPPAVTFEHLLVQNFVGIPGGVFSRAAAIEVGGLDPDLWYTADWDFWLKLAAAGPTAYLPRPLAGFRIHAHSQTAVRSKSRDEFRAQHDETTRRHLSRWEARSDAVRRSVMRANRAAVELNVALAAKYHGQAADWGALAAALAPLNPTDWRRLVRDSRIWERVSARLRAGFAAHRLRSETATP